MPELKATQALRELKILDSRNIPVRLVKPVENGKLLDIRFYPFGTGLHPWDIQDDITEKEVIQLLDYWGF